MSKQVEPQPTVDESLLLSKALEDIDRNIYLAKRGFDQANVPTALAHMSALIQHLRTSKLSPDNYYELWMRVTECLSEVEGNFDDLNTQYFNNEGGYSVMQLHETVQYCGDIIPRLYLLITVSSTYIRSKKAPAKDVLFDLVELCRGVQHPMRGLFLRSYLCQMAKDKLPDVGTEYEGYGGTCIDAIEFILQNFGEMNKLWVRMQHQGPVRERSKREKQRRALRQLIGANLVRLSSLVGLTCELYCNEVLPRILEHVVNCKDVIAQEFLMDCIIQVFPDDFHLASLSLYLTALSQLHEKVNRASLFISFLNRLANYATQIVDGTITNVVDTQGNTGLNVFNNVFTAVSSTMSTFASGIDVLSQKIQLYSTLLHFVAIVHSDRLDYIDTIYEQMIPLCASSAFQQDPVASSALVEALSVPLKFLGISFLSLTNYESVLLNLQYSDRKEVALEIVRKIIDNNIILSDVGLVESLFTLILPLSKPDTSASNASAEAEDSVEIQYMLCRLFHNITSTETDMYFKMLLAVRKFFGQGGTSRIEYTLQTVIYGAFQLIEQIVANEQAKANGTYTGPEEVKVKPKRVFSFIHETITVLIEPYPEIALRLFLIAATLADKCAYEHIAYEFVAQAFMTYESEIADSKAQLYAINLIVSTLPTLNMFSLDNYETLATKATQHCSRYIVKADQARAVANCAHLHWPANKNHVGRDEKKVISRLKRAVSVARDLIGNHTHLFVEILDKYIYFYEKGCPSIDVEIIETLSSYIVECLTVNDGSAQSQIAATHYANTLAKLEAKGILSANK